MFGKDEIHELILSFAEVGANVVRLKGGDPLVSCCFFFVWGLMLITKRPNYVCCVENLKCLISICRCLAGVGKRWISCGSKGSKSRSSLVMPMITQIYTLGLIWYFSAKTA